MGTNREGPRRYMRKPSLFLFFSQEGFMPTSKVTIIIESEDRIETIEIPLSEHENFNQNWVQPTLVNDRGGLDEEGDLELSLVVFSCQPQRDPETGEYLTRTEVPK